MRPSIGLLGLVALVAPAVLAQNNPPPAPTNRPSSASQTSAKASQTTEAPKSSNEPSKTEDSKTEDSKTSEASSTEESETTSSPTSESSSDGGRAITSLDVTTTSKQPDPTGPVFRLTALPSIAGVGIPSIGVPDTAGAAFMQKSDLPDGTVFICVGAVLAFLGAAVLAWRGLVAWSLHRSVKRAAMAQNLADLKAMSAVPGKKRGMYNVVGASSTMSLDHLAAAPTGTSKPPKPFASNPTGTPPKSTSSLFFSPTAGGSAGLRDSTVNRSSNYLPAGYYAAGNAQPASGSPMTHVGGHNAHLSAHSLATPGNRFSTRSGISPPTSPSLPPSRGYDRAPPSRDGLSLYNRNSVATLSAPNGRGVYGQEHGNPSQSSLNVPGGATTGGRAPSAYLEDLFESHGNGPRERF